jgi:Na+/melibiose symporter-like transporter
MDIKTTPSDNEDASAIFNTTRTHVLVGLFTFFTTFQIASMSVIGLTQYVTNWNLPLLWYFNAGGVSVLANSLTEFGVSTFADSYQSPYGRRKPFVFAGMVLTTIAAAAICIPPVHTVSFSIAWYLLVIIIYNIGAGMYSAFIFCCNICIKCDRLAIM